MECIVLSNSRSHAVSFLFLPLDIREAFPPTLIDPFQLRTVQPPQLRHVSLRSFFNRERDDRFKRIAQVTMPVCSTSVWNQTSTNLAGSTGNRGSTAILMYNPTSSAFDIYGNLFVADTVNARIQYFARGDHFSWDFNNPSTSSAFRFDYWNNGRRNHI